MITAFQCASCHKTVRTLYGDHMCRGCHVESEWTEERVNALIAKQMARLPKWWDDESRREINEAHKGSRVYLEGNTAPRVLDIVSKHPGINHLDAADMLGMKTENQRKTVLHGFYRCEQLRLIYRRETVRRDSRGCVRRSWTWYPAGYAHG